MSRLFVEGSSQRLVDANAPVVSTPFTFAAHVYHTAASSNYILSVGDVSISNNFWALRLDQFHTPQWVRLDPGQTDVLAVGVGGNVGLNAWGHLVGTATSDNAVAIYGNGAGKNTSVVDVNPAGWDNLTIATSADSTPSAFFNGRIFLPAIWNIALTDTEVWMLGHLKWSPDMLNIRRRNLVFYAPLTREHNDRDIINGLQLTAVNSPTWSDDPQGIVYSPSHLRSFRRIR